jgi:hypothetical protein
VENAETGDEGGGDGEAVATVETSSDDWEYTPMSEWDRD